MIIKHVINYDILLIDKFFFFKNVYKNETIKELSASKLELLHQRITKRDYTSGRNINPANDFPGVQMFFKEFIIMLLGNGIFCKHFIDTLVYRIDVLNAMEWATELQEGKFISIYYIYLVKLLNNIFFKLIRCYISENIFLLC